MTKRILLIGGCGYIGSALYQHLKRQGRNVDTLDSERRDNWVNPDNIKIDYAAAPLDFLAKYGCVLWFAGHSSVGQAVKDPKGALMNNVVNLFALAQKLSPKQRLIYASSSSVYNGTPRAEGALEGDMPAAAGNAYDVSKFAADQMMQVAGRNFAGLRLGTLAGPSPNRRDDLVINAMTKSAILDGRVNVSNGKNRRSILGTGDACRAVEKLVDAFELESGFYNLASFKTTIMELGELVSSRFGVPLVEGADSPSYDYCVATDKFSKAFGFEFTDTAESLIDETARQVREE